MALSHEDSDDDYLGDLSRFLPPEHLPPPVPSKSTAQQASEVPKGKLNWQEKKMLKREKEQKLEDEHRLVGLRSAISSSNIGFKMLQQMGYSPGLALGKHGQGSLEPINVDVKRSRTGLGRDSMMKVAKDRQAKMGELELQRKRRKEEALTAKFQAKKRSFWQNKKIVSDYRKAYVALSQLEEIHVRDSGYESRSRDQLSLEENTEQLEVEGLKDEGAANENLKEDDAEEEITEEALQELLERLRTKYFYCLYCGCQYDTAESLLGNCPGLDEDDH